MNRPTPRLVACLVAACGTAGVASAQAMNWDGSCGTNLWGSCCWNGQSGGACRNNTNFASGEALCPDCPAFPGITNDVDFGWASVTLDVPGTVRSMFAWNPFTLANDLYAVEQAMFGGPLIAINGSSVRNGVFTSESSVSIVNGMGIREGAELQVAGTGTWQSGAIVLDDGTIRVQPGATFLCQANSAIAPVSILGQVINNGTVRKDSGTGTTTIQAMVTTAAMIATDVGTLNLAAGGTLGGYLQAGAGATLRLSGTSAFIAQNGLNFFGPGTLAIDAPFNVGTGATITSTNVTFGPSGSREGGGRHNITGTFVPNGLFNAGGETEVRPGGTLAFPASTTVQMQSHTLIHRGTAAWPGGSCLVFGPSSSWVNYATVNITGDVAIAKLPNPAGPGSVYNNATFTKAAGAGVSTLDANFFNAGVLTLSSGTFRCATFTQTAGSTVLLGGDLAMDGDGTGSIQGGTIGGTAAFRGWLYVHAATVSPGASIGTLSVLDSPWTVGGHFQMLSGASRLEIEVGGTGTGQFDTLMVEDSAALNGVVRVSFVSGFVPEDGQTFRFLNCGSRTGTFMSLEKVNAPEGLEMSIAYDDFGATLVMGNVCDGDVNCDFALDGFDVETQEKAVGGDTTDFCQPDPDFNRDFALDGFDVEAVELVVGGGPCP